MYDNVLSLSDCVAISVQGLESLVDRKVILKYYEAFVFPQNWPSSIGGLSGQGTSIGKQSYTIVFRHRTTRMTYVFFEGVFGYKIFKPTELFDDDFYNLQVPSVDKFKKNITLFEDGLEDIFSGA